MTKEYTSLGLMSGTSGDGVDASIIQSDGNTKYQVIKDQYFKYDEQIYQNIHNLKEKIYNIKQLEKLTKELNDLEKQITLFGVTIRGKFLTADNPFSYKIMFFSDHSLKYNTHLLPCVVHRVFFITLFSKQITCTLFSTT